MFKTPKHTPKRFVRASVTAPQSPAATSITAPLRSAAAKRPEFGSAEITLIEDGGPIFEDTPSRQIVWESHNDEVSLAPPGFTVTAKSTSCAIQAMQNLELKRFGLQFHPEVNDTEYGSKIFENFVDICKRAKK